MKHNHDRNYKAARPKVNPWLRMALVFLLTLILFSSGCEKGAKESNQAFAKVPDNPKPGAMVRADPQRTGVYPDSGKVPEGVFLWKVKEKSLPIIADPVISTERLAYNVFWGNAVVCCDAVSGEIRWRYVTDAGNEKTMEPPPELPTPPISAGDAIFFGTIQGKLHALDAETGEKVWVFQAGDEITSSPIVQDGVVYFGCADNHFYALDAQTGEEIWKCDVGAPVISSPAFEEGSLFLFVGTVETGYGVLSLDAREGEERWRFEVAAWPKGFAPCVSGGMVYFVHDDDCVYALDTSTGKLAWKKRVTDGYLMHAPAAYKGKLYLGESEGYVYALDQKTGEEIWKAKLEKGVTSSPSVADGVLYVSSEDQNLYALDCETGKEIWRVFLGMDSAGSPAIMDGVVYTCAGAIR